MPMSMVDEESEELPDIPEWGGVGIFDREAVEIMTAHLREDELAVARDLHLESDWPAIKVEFKAIGRKGHLGKNGKMMAFRPMVARLLLRLAWARRTALATEEGSPS